MKYKPVVPEEIAKQVVSDVRQYKEENKLSDYKLSKTARIGMSTIQKWWAGTSLPRLSSVARLVDAGMTSVKLPEIAQGNAVKKVLTDIDDKNKPTRSYRKRVFIPDIVQNQIKLLIDDYVDGLDSPKTFNEFKTTREEFITKLYYTCRQGE